MGVRFDLRDAAFFGAAAAGFDPEEEIERVERLLVELARYLRQPIADMEERTLAEINRWVGYANAMIEAENRGGRASLDLSRFRDDDR